jgi:hypothetical protein
MEEDWPSRTAESLNQTLDKQPKILDDPVAMRLVDPSSDSTSHLWKAWSEHRFP